MLLPMSNLGEEGSKAAEFERRLAIKQQESLLEELIRQHGILPASKIISNLRDPVQGLWDSLSKASDGHWQEEGWYPTGVFPYTVSYVPVVIPPAKEAEITLMKAKIGEEKHLHIVGIPHPDSLELPTLLYYRRENENGIWVRQTSIPDWVNQKHFKAVYGVWVKTMNISPEDIYVEVFTFGPNDPDDKEPIPKSEEQVA